MVYTSNTSLASEEAVTKRKGVSDHRVQSQESPGGALAPLPSKSLSSLSYSVCEMAPVFTVLLVGAKLGNRTYTGRGKSGFTVVHVENNTRANRQE